jgi:LVIVD repeat
LLLAGVVAYDEGPDVEPGSVTRRGSNESRQQSHSHHEGAGGGRPVEPLGASGDNVELVGRLRLTRVQGGVSDVSAFGDHAYLGSFRKECKALGGAGGGVHIVDISAPRRPRKVGFVPAHDNSYVGEGVHVVHVRTRFFRGDILVHNNEPCNREEPFNGGVSLWDVTHPSHPRPLALGVGDDTPASTPNIDGVHGSHSAQGFTIDEKAYVVLVDNEESSNVDILDITDPRNPRQIADLGIESWPRAQDNIALGARVYHHDMQVEQIDGHTYLLVSYWDAGWILLDIDDPSHPRFVADYDHPSLDPLTGLSPPEGNAHQAYFSSDDRFIVGTDEDFSPYRTSIEIPSARRNGQHGAGSFTWTKALPRAGLRGSPVWGGSGCRQDLNGNGESDQTEVPRAPDSSQQGSEAAIVVFERGACFFSEKVETGQVAGYDAVVIGQSHEETDAGRFPDAFTCGSKGHQFRVRVAAFCVGHRALHLLFGQEPRYSPSDRADVGLDMPPIGAQGLPMQFRRRFDGWGYVHLIDARTLEELDAYAVPQALDPRFARGRGSLSAHEVKTDPRIHVRLAYLAYYNAGLRVVSFRDNRLEEVGHYMHEKGNEFWGVFPHFLGTDPNNVRPSRREEDPLVLASDRNSGLWIFRYTGR